MIAGKIESSQIGILNFSFIIITETFMKNLFAPWRMNYIQNANKSKGCFICRALESKNEEKTLALYIGEYTIVLMNRYPYNPGHIMICPKKHVKYPYDLNLQESS